MSLLSNLFNRKERTMDSSNPKEDTDYLDTEEDELEEADSNIMMNSSEQLELGDSDTDVVYEVVEREIHPAKVVCPDCGGITLEGLDFCDKCGGEL